MFGVDESLKFNTLHGFGCPTKHETFCSLKKQSANLPHIRFLVGKSKNIIMVGDSHPSRILFSCGPHLSSLWGRNRH